MKEIYSLVSIIAANYNGAHLLPECLSSLREQDYPHIEITVMDNGSTDESRRVTKNYGAEFIQLGYNYGLSVAYNRGAEASSGNYIFFVNNDMRFEKDCVSQLVRVLEQRNNSIFAADPLQYDWEGNNVIHYQGVFVRISSLKSIFSEMFLPLPPLIKTYVPCQEITEVPWGCAGSLMVKRDMFEELGGFDKTFFIDFEDTDLCWRAWLRGWRTLFVPQAKLYHKWSASFDEKSSKKNKELREKLPRLVFQRIVSQQKNYQRFALKVLDTASILLIFSVKLVSVFLYPFVRKTVISIAILKALFLTLKELRDTLNSRKHIKKTAILSNRQIISRFWYKKAPTALVWPSSDLTSRKGKQSQ
jgi:GT2 family glycosyltransferase